MDDPGFTVMGVALWIAVICGGIAAGLAAHSFWVGGCTAMFIAASLFFLMCVGAEVTAAIQSASKKS